MLTINSIDPICVSKSAFRCPHCGEALSEWLNLHELLDYLHISNTQRHRLERDGFIPQPTMTLGDRSPRWRRAEIDAALKAGERIAGVLSHCPVLPPSAPARSADAAIDAAVAAITGGGEATETALPMTEWR